MTRTTMQTPVSNRLTTGGASWLTAALDPFHDYQVPITGIPDGLCTPSFTRVHTQTVGISALAAGDRIRVSFNGMHATTLNHFKSISDVRNQSSIDFTTALPCMAPVSVIRSSLAQGSVCCWNTVAAGNANLLAWLGLTPDYTTPSRVIAMGLEIHDTTAPLNRQGILGCVHVPGQVQIHGGRVLTSTVGDLNLGHITLSPSMPSTRTQASLIPGYVEWEAEKGVYLTARMQRPVDPVFFMTSQATATATMPSMVNVGIEAEQAADSSTSPYEVWAVSCPSSAVQTASPARNTALIYPSFYSGFQPFEIWLDGLAATSTFRIVLRTIVEYFPETTDATVLPNATAIPSFDPEALLQYHRARSVLPAGVPVAMNAKGDWWRMVSNAFRVGASLAARVAPATLSLLGAPQLAAGATLLTNALGAPIPVRPKKKPGKRPKRKGSN